MNDFQCPHLLRATDLDTVLDYYLDQARDETRPAEILLALCRLKWPASEFFISFDAEGDQGLYFLGDVVDEWGNRVRLP